MTNETDDNKRWDWLADGVHFELVDGESNYYKKLQESIFVITTHHDQGGTRTYKIKNNLTMEEAKFLINGLSDTDFDVSAIATIEEAETIIDMIIKRQYPDAIEEV